MRRRLLSTAVYPSSYPRGYPRTTKAWNGVEAIVPKKIGWGNDTLPGMSRLVGQKGVLNWGALIEKDIREVEPRTLAEWIHRFQVVIFKRATLTPAEHVEIARNVTPYLGAQLPLTLATDMGFRLEDLVAGYPEIAVLGATDEKNPLLGTPVNNSVKGIQWPEFGPCSWHADGAAFETVGSITFLHMPRAPQKDDGGATFFASGYDVYDNLPAALKEVVKTRNIRYIEDGNWEFEYDMKKNGMRRLNFPGDVEKSFDHEHPLAPVHPVTGRRTIWAAPANVAFSHDQDIVETCLETGLQDFYVHHYDEGDVCISDDRCCFHSVSPSAPNVSRVLHRVGTELRSQRNRSKEFQYIYGDDVV